MMYISKRTELISEIYGLNHIRKEEWLCQEKYQQFIHDPNVRKAVVSAKDVVETTLDTVVDSIKNSLKKDDDKDNKEE